MLVREVKKDELTQITDINTGEVITLVVRKSNNPSRNRVAIEAPKNYKIEFLRNESYDETTS